jgi:hypothetical protein
MVLSVLPSGLGWPCGPTPFWNVVKRSSPGLLENPVVLLKTDAMAITARRHSERGVSLTDLGVY